MTRSADCRKRAQEYVELARSASDSERSTLLELAEAWLKLAQEVTALETDLAPLQRPNAPSTDRVQ
jgi:hypothetical protein